MDIKKFFNPENISRKKKIKTGIGVALGAIVIAAGTLVVLDVTQPYAITADGDVVEEPWDVTIDGETVCMAASEEEANQLIEDITSYYLAEDSDVKTVEVKEELSAQPTELKRGMETPVVDDMEETLEYIMTGVEEKVTYEVKKGDTAWEIADENNISVDELEEWNEDTDLDDLHKGDIINLYETNPLVTVSSVEEITYTKEIDYDTKYIKSSKLYIGETKVKTEGEKGEKTITAVVTKENGETVDKDILSSEVTKEPVKAVVYKGTKARGSAVVEYARKFLGNPYVYGGASLTNGTDCSGFTMSVYAHFGYSLPHNSYAQLNCGKAVSYSEAQPGDLIIYANHVALYAGNGTIIHASSPRTGITTGSATYRAILGVRRIIN